MVTGSLKINVTGLQGQGQGLGSQGQGLGPQGQGLGPPGQGLGPPGQGPGQHGSWEQTDLEEDDKKFKVGRYIDS